MSQIFNNNMFHVWREKKGVEICAILSFFLFVILSWEKYKLANSIVTFTQFEILVSSLSAFFWDEVKKNAFFESKLDVRIDMFFAHFFSLSLLMWNIRQRIICSSWKWNK